MKKILGLSVAAILCIAIVAIAGDDKKMGGKANEGTITKLDKGAMMMVVKDSAGTETTVYWNDKTKTGGSEMKEGALVHWKGAEKDGKMWATWVHVGEMKKM